MAGERERRMKKRVLPLFFAALSAVRAGIVAQFDSGAENFDLDGQDRVLAWRSASGPSLVPALTNSPAWTLAALDVSNASRGVCFNLASNPASPLTFGPSTESPVATLFLVADTPAEGYSTLFFAPVTATVTPHAPAAEYDGAEASDGLLRVNGAESLLFGQALRHIVEADFAQPVPPSGLFIGGAPVCAAWGQGWKGAVHAMVALDAPPSEGARRAIRKYLALRYGVAGVSPAGPDDAAEAAALGLNAHGLFGAKVILR